MEENPIYNHVIMGITINDRPIAFDGFAIESYIQYQDEDGTNCVELNFESGKTICVYSEVDKVIYPEESIETLVDDCLCKRYKVLNNL